ncbi:MAG: hypothetical protein J6K16_06535 [Alphaproteobacteria bacterium]|nr:hypothetical protein [Alphaproteobacteria bacterium]
MQNGNENLSLWLKKHFAVDEKMFFNALKMSPSALGYIHGAISELLLVKYLTQKGYEVMRIKEKPAGGFDEKKIGYKGDFLINKKGDTTYWVVECKGLKTNSEFRGAKTEDTHLKKLSKDQAFNTLKKFIDIDKQKIYNKGKSTYLTAKAKWEKNNPQKTFPDFNWNTDFPGPDYVDLSPFFHSVSELKKFVYNCDENLLTETAFRNGTGLYKILQTHKPSNRTDTATGIKQAAPISSDFSILAVDLYQRLGEHLFVFVNPDIISHSPTSPNHLYQNYTIDIIIPGIKDNLSIRHPWYLDLNECIEETHPKTVEYDESQIDYREG